MSKNLDANGIGDNLERVNQLISDVMADKASASKLKEVLKFNNALKSTIKNKCRECKQCKSSDESNYPSIISNQFLVVQAD